MRIGLKIISLLKVTRGIGALSLAACLFWASNQTLPELREMLSSFRFIHVMTSSTGLISDLFSNLTENNLFELSVLVLLFSVIRFSEAYGIWFNQSWAEWLAVLTGFATAIFFLERIFRGYEQSIMIILVLNILVISYLLWVLLTKKKLLKI